MKVLVWMGMLVLGGGVCWGQGGMAGNWATGDGSVVKVAACGPELCLSVAKVDPKAPVATDVKNPDAAMRTRPLCGLRIGSGFKPDGVETASGGRLYDPKSGRTYSGKIWLKDGALHLRGFVGVSLFGRSEVWTRVGSVEACR